jgi:hypothetical protein
MVASDLNWHKPTQFIRVWRILEEQIKIRGNQDKPYPAAKVRTVPGFFSKSALHLLLLHNTVIEEMKQE